MCSSEEILSLEREIVDLRRLLEKKEERLKELKNSNNCNFEHSLCNNEIIRYSRQMILPLLGVEGQEKLKNSSVLVIGCGGLGCPAGQYLASCGIGNIGLVDYDTIEVSNLHRQILYKEKHVGLPKAKIASSVLNSLNNNINATAYDFLLDSSAIEIFSKYDIIIDATDNVVTRYLINDACVLAGRPLISGSAVRLEGQLTVYNYKNGPCYRCLFPVPPPPEATSNCGDVGVLGPGIIGILQALQAIHIILGNECLSEKLLLFDAADTSFRTIQLRSKNKNCDVCGENGKIKKLIDYEQFCNAAPTDKGQSVKLLAANQRISTKELSVLLSSNPLLVDVRSPTEFNMCKIPGSVNIPMSCLNKLETTEFHDLLQKRDDPVYVICRRGNDSQIAVKKLQELYRATFYDVKGGLHAWATDINNKFPIY